MENYEVVKADFNEIAQLDSDPKWNHNNCYFSLLLKQIPENAELCLDIGCGKGELSFLIAQKAGKVIAVDIAEKMIEQAKKRFPKENIEYVCKNVLNIDFDDDSLDLIISTATAHHLPYEWLLEFSKKKLRKGGKLILLDLAKADTIRDRITWGAAVIPNIAMNLIKNGRLPKTDIHAAEVWQKHGAHDVYMTIDEIKTLAIKYIPDAKITRKLFWRYCLLWEK